jgi:hypothetical protein
MKVWVPDIRQLTRVLVQWDSFKVGGAPLPWISQKKTRDFTETKLKLLQLTIYLYLEMEGANLEVRW